MAGKDWERIVASYKESGLSQAEYARRHGLKVSQLTYYVNNNRGSSHFIKLKPDAADNSFEVELKSGVKLKLPLEVEPGILQRLVGALNADA